MTPCHNLVSNLVYSADGSVVDTTIVDGKVIMLHGCIEGEEEVLEKQLKERTILLESTALDN